MQVSSYFPPATSFPEPFPASQAKDTTEKQNSCTEETCQHDNRLDIDSYITCKDCGKVISFAISSSRRNLDWRSGEEKNYNLEYGYKRSVYKRDDHVMDFFYNLTASKIPNIDDDVYVMIEKELKNRGIENKNATSFHVRRILRDLKKARYYEYVPLFLQYLKSEVEPLPKITPDTRDILFGMYKRVASVFPAIRKKHPKQKNFVPLHFIFYRICGLLKDYRTQRYFRLPRTRRVLEKNDEIWRDICEEIGWSYKGIQE